MLRISPSPEFFCWGFRPPQVVPGLARQNSLSEVASSNWGGRNPQHITSSIMRKIDWTIFSSKYNIWIGFEDLSLSGADSTSLLNYLTWIRFHSQSLGSQKYCDLRRNFALKIKALIVILWHTTINIWYNKLLRLHFSLH